MDSRRCARPGCRAWAMHGRRFCSAHRDLAIGDDMLGPTEGPADPDGRECRAGTFARAARAGRSSELIERAVRQVISDLGEDRSLQQEIGSLRIVLQRVMAMDGLEGDPAQTATTVTGLVETIIRAVKAQRVISDELADSVASALTTVLIEMGLEERGE